MKALEILKEHRYSLECLLRTDVVSHLLKQTNEAIKELETIQDIMLEKDEALEIERLLFKNKIEELNNRSCENCIFAYRDKNKKIDDVQGQILGSEAKWSYCKKIMINITKDFCCNRYEKKDSECK